MIRRDKYLNQLIVSKNNGFPKVITGVRRCGKSYLLNTIYKQYLLDNGVLEQNILLIELDDDKNATLGNPLELGKYVREYCKLAAGTAGVGTASKIKKYLSQITYGDGFLSRIEEAIL